MKKVLFTLATLLAFGLTAGAQDKPAPQLAFGTDANNLITEIELAPGETSEELHMVLVDIQETVVQGFQMQWIMKDANGNPTEAIVCPKIYGGRVKTWTNPENISTADENVGGSTGNSLASANPLPATWRWVGTNTSSNQFWWNTDYDGNPIAPICVGAFKIEVPADWAEPYATFELDKEYTLYNQTPSETPADAVDNYEARPTIDQILVIKNKNYTPADQPLTGEVIIGEVDAENGLLPVSYNGDEDVTITVTVNGEVVEIVDGNVQLAEGDNTVVVTVAADGYETIENTYNVNWTKPEPPQPVQTPAPEIVVTPGEEAYTFEAVGEGTVTLFVNNVEVENPYTINRTDADQVVTVTAVAHVDGQIDGTVTGEYMIPALEVLPPVVTPTPEINYEVTDDAVIITATGEGEVLLYVDGALVENPCTIERGDADVVVVVTATAQGENMEISEEASMEITIPAIGETPEDPHMTGIWIVLTDLDGVEHWYSMNPDPNGEPNWSLMMTLHHQPWDINVPFYFMVNGVRYGAENDMQLPAMGDQYQTVLNPVFEGENYWYVPAGYPYTWGLQFKDGQIWLLVAQGPMTGIDEMNAGKTVANVRYFNMAGQEMQEANGMTIVVTTYTDGTTNAVKVMK